MNWIVTTYTTILFIIFTPNFLFTISKKISKISTAIIHSILFAIVFYTTINIIYNSRQIYENICNITEPVKQCNEKNIDCQNDKEQICILNSDSNYAWDVPCNSKNIGAISYSNNLKLQCTNTSLNNKKEDIYNWVPVNI